jgi:hypothetical protein
MSAASIARAWGATDADRTRSFACDRRLTGAREELFRAVDVDAPPPVVFRWLCQLRVAPYSYDWIDNLGRRSPSTLTPGLDALRVGQRFMTAFELVEFERDVHLTVVLRPCAVLGRLAVSYVVLPRGEAGSRLVVKLAVQYPGGPIGWALRRMLPWADLVMMRKQLLTVKRLAEDAAHARMPGRARAMRNPRAISATTSCTATRGSRASRMGRPSTR